MPTHYICFQQIFIEMAMWLEKARKGCKQLKCNHYRFFSNKKITDKIILIVLDW